MSEKFITPRTSLREAINNASGPVAMSNRNLLQFGALSFLLVLVSSPSRLEGSFFEWVIVATVGYLATLAVLLAFRATLLPATEGREPKRLVTSIAYFVSGAVRGVAIYLVGASLGIMPEAEFWYRLIGGPLFVYGGMSMLAIFNASRERHERALANLETEKAELDELRGGIRERIRLQRADLLKRVQAALAPAVEQVKNELQTSPQSISYKLRDVVDTVVRPLSHDIGRNTDIDQEVSSLSRRAAVAYSKGRFPTIVSAGAMLVPELMLFATASIAIVSNLISFPEQAFFASLVSLVAIWVFYKVAQKIMQNFWVPFWVSLLLTIFVAILNALFVYGLLYVFGLVLSLPLLLQFMLSQVLIALVSYYMQFLRTQRKAAESEMTRVISDLAILNSQLRQEVWLNRRRIASILHGSVQSALYASAIRLAKIESPTPQEIDGVQSDIGAAISKLESVEGAETFSEVLNQIQTVWEGVVEVQVPEITPEVLTKLAANQVASACAAEVVREAVSNAVKHGGAEHIVIGVELNGPHLLGITVTNDGQSLPAEIEAGYGSTIMDEVAFSWQLENRGGYTVLGAAIAI